MIKYPLTGGHLVHTMGCQELEHHIQSQQRSEMPPGCFSHQRIRLQVWGKAPDTMNNFFKIKILITVVCVHMCVLVCVRRRHRCHRSEDNFILGFHLYMDSGDWAQVTPRLGWHAPSPTESKSPKDSFYMCIAPLNHYKTTVNKNIMSPKVSPKNC